MYHGQMASLRYSAPTGDLWQKNRAQQNMSTFHIKHQTYTYLTNIHPYKTNVPCSAEQQQTFVWQLRSFLCISSAVEFK